MSGDVDLVARCLAGDPVAWEEASRRVVAVSRAVCGRLCRARGLPEGEWIDEVAGDVRAALVERDGVLLRRYDPRWSLATWLGQIARSKCLTRLRARRGAPMPQDPTEPQDDPSWTVASRGEEVERLHRALASLPVRPRSILVLIYRDGLTHREVGRRLGLAPSGIGVLAARALAALRRAMEAGEGRESSAAGVSGRGDDA